MVPTLESILMARMDGKRGRFNNDQATDSILEGMRGYAENNGDWLTYFRFDPLSTVMDDVYDEAISGGLKYHPALRVQCVHVTHVEGGNEDSDLGFYYNDDLDAAIAFDQFLQAGMKMADIQTGNYLKDRVLYDRKIFAVKQLAVQGQVQQRDIIIGLSATQVKPDELVNDAQFAQWSLGGPNDIQGTE
jgi:hypothetical protein